MSEVLVSTSLLLVVQYTDGRTTCKLSLLYVPYLHSPKYY